MTIEITRKYICDRCKGEIKQHKIKDKMINTLYILGHYYFHLCIKCQKDFKEFMGK